MIRFIHTADIHFGMENYGKIDTITGIHTRLLDFKRALDFCIDYAIKNDVDFFMFSGDAYKTHHPTQTQQRLFMQCFLQLYKAKIPVVIVVGNHDHPLSFGKANALDIFSELPLNGFHVITKPTTLNLQTKNGIVQIVGIPWPTRNSITINDKHLSKKSNEITTYIAKAVAQIIKKHAQELDPTIPAILAGHLTVSSGLFSGSEKRAIYGTDPILLPSQLAIQPFDYVALGHLHRYQNLNQNGYPAIVYSGSIERIDFGERKEDKGFCDVKIHKKDKTTHQFVKGPMRPFIQLDVALDHKQDQTEQIITEIKKYDITDAIVKIKYHFKTQCTDTVDLKLVQRACATALYIAGIIPVFPPKERHRRITGAYKTTMSLEHLLKLYFETKKTDTPRMNDLIKKTLTIAQELEDEKNS